MKTQKAMKGLKIFTLCAGFAILFSACDEVDQPIEGNAGIGEENAPDFPENKNTSRTIVLEEFTGIQCGNCPGGAVIAAEIHDGNPDRVILVGTHAGGLAEPNPPGSDHLTTEFRTPQGDAYYGSNFANPIAYVNNVAFNNGDNTLFSPEWVSAAEAALMDEEAAVKLQIINNQDADGGDVTWIKTEWISATTGEFALIVWLLEDGIVDEQLNYDGTGDPSYPSGIVEDYVHKHVFRTSVTSAFGTPIASNPDPQSANEEDHTSVVGFPVELNAAWDVNNIEVVALVVNSDTGEIMNATKANLVE